MLRLYDSKGVAFERAPNDLHCIRPTLYLEDEKLFFLSGGARREVTQPELIAEIIERGAEYADVNELVIERVPKLAPLFSEHDLPIDDIIRRNV
jgi:hypothetical protein